MQTITELWKTGAFTEDMIVHSLQCSYLDFRRALIEDGAELPDTLSKGMHLEIYRMYSSGVDARYERLKWIAANYGISPTTASKFRSKAPTSRDLLLHTEEDIKKFIEAGVDADTIIEKFKVSKHKLKKLRGVSHKRVIPDEVVEGILADLKSHMPQADIAAKYGVSASTVSKINPDKISKPKSKPLDDDEWQLVKTSLQRYSISEVARMHNVSRAYIYGRLAKEKA